MTNYLIEKDFEILMDALDCYVRNDYLLKLNEVIINGMLTEDPNEQKKIFRELRDYKGDKDKEEIAIMLKAKLLLIKNQIVEERK